MEVGGAEARLLRVEIREEPALQQRVVGEVDARHNVGRQEGGLLVLGEVVVRIAVQNHAADDPYRGDFFRHDLGRIENAVGQFRRQLLGDDLDTEFPFRKRAGFDRFPEVAAVEVIIGALQLGGFVPDERLHAELRLPVKLDKRRLPFRVHKAEGVNTEALHHAVGARDPAVGHCPDHGVHGFGHQGDEIPERVVGGRGLREAAVGLHFHRVDEVRELDGVLDEEDRDVVADEIPVAFIGVEFHGEAAHVSRCIDGARAAGDRGETCEERRAFAGFGEEASAGEIGDRFRAFEKSVCGASAGVDDAFGDALMVEVEDLFAQHEIFKQRRTERAGLQAVLVVGDRHAMIGGEQLAARLVQLPCISLAGLVCAFRHRCTSLLAAV